MAIPACCALVPAFDAAATVGGVVEELRATLQVPVLVVDDGSRDATTEVARTRGAEVVVHRRNLGKGAALRTGMREAARRGFRSALTVDADGQHPADSARAVLEGSDDPAALVLGVRDLVRDAAPRANRFGNAVSNFFLSRLALPRRTLRDTQCGLRRYPVAETLALAVRSHGYAFEAEILLRALAAGMHVVQVPIRAIYSHSRAQQTHFRSVRDPARIVWTVVRTSLELRLRAR
jgi:glycosyltransferase involved in cell wall biosynthesis